MNPTRGIDLGAHADIIWAIKALCVDGMALLVISSELEEMTGYADRIIVLRDRRHVAELAYQKISVAGIMQAIAAQPEKAPLSSKPLSTPSGASRIRWSMPSGSTQCLALLAILIIDDLVSPHFFSLHIQDGRLFGSVIDIINRVAPVAFLLALGMTLVIATGGIGLSVGAVAATLIDHHVSLPVALGETLVAGVACGLWNGFLIAVLGMQPIVATLILMVVYMLCGLCYRRGRYYHYRRHLGGGC